MEEAVLYKTPSKTAIQWFVVHVKWRKELEFAALADGDGLRTFVAKRNVLKEQKRNGRVVAKTRTEVVEIPEIVFVNATHDQMEAIIGKAEREAGLKVYYARDMRDGHRRIMTVRPQDMESFICIASQSQEGIAFLKPEEVALAKGDVVRIHGGAFDGAVGTLLMVKGKKGKRVVVSIAGLAAVAAAYVTPDYIEVISTKDSDAEVGVAEIDELQAAAEAYVPDGDNSAEATSRQKALDVMAAHVLKSRGKSPSPSKDLALLTYAKAVGDNALAAKMTQACEKHLESLRPSALRTRLESILKG